MNKIKSQFCTAVNISSKILLFPNIIKSLPIKYHKKKKKKSWFDMYHILRVSSVC